MAYYHKNIIGLFISRYALYKCIIKQTLRQTGYEPGHPAVLLQRVKESFGLRDTHLSLTDKTINGMIELIQDADNKYGGDIDKLLGDYNIASYNGIYNDRIDFKNSAMRSKKSKLNRFMIDYDGEHRLKIFQPQNGLNS